MEHLSSHLTITKHSTGMEHSATFENSAMANDSTASIDPTTTRPGDVVTRLPTELQLDIFELLDYQSAIRLSQVSKYFQATIDPRSWPAAEKASFVLLSERWLKHNRVKVRGSWCENGLEQIILSNGFACFHCYRVRPRSAFSQNQSTQDNSKARHWRYTRFCIDCGISEGIYKPGTHITVTTSETNVFWETNNEQHLCKDMLVVCGECKAATPHVSRLNHLLCDHCEVEKPHQHRPMYDASERIGTPDEAICIKCGVRSMHWSTEWCCTRCNTHFCPHCSRPFFLDDEDDTEKPKCSRVRKIEYAGKSRLPGSPEVENLRERRRERRGQADIWDMADAEDVVARGVGI